MIDINIEFAELADSAVTARRVDYTQSFWISISLRRAAVTSTLIDVAPCFARPLPAESESRMKINIGSVEIAMRDHRAYHGYVIRE